MYQKLPVSKLWGTDEGFITGYVLCLKILAYDTVEISQISYDSVFSREKILG